MRTDSQDSLDRAHDKSNDCGLYTPVSAVHTVVRSETNAYVCPIHALSTMDDRCISPLIESIHRAWHLNDLIYQLVKMTYALTYTKIILILRNVRYPVGGRLPG